MKTIVDISIAPTRQAAVTPCELLEDFSDSTPDWHFLEEDTAYYASIKGVPACILRHIQRVPHAVTDFAFAASEADERSTFHLILIETQHQRHSSAAELRHAVVVRFVDAFNHYLERRGMHAEIHVVERERDLVAG